MCAAARPAKWRGGGLGPRRSAKLGQRLRGRRKGLARPLAPRRRLQATGRRGEGPGACAGGTPAGAAAGSFAARPRERATQRLDRAAARRQPWRITLRTVAINSAQISAEPSIASRMAQPPRLMRRRGAGRGAGSIAASARRGSPDRAARCLQAIAISLTSTSLAGPCRGPGRRRSQPAGRPAAGAWTARGGGQELARKGAPP